MLEIFHKNKTASYIFVAATNSTSVILSIIGGGGIVLPITSRKTLADFEWRIKF